jgi:hypothetical protein
LASVFQHSASALEREHRPRVLQPEPALLPAIGFTRFRPRAQKEVFDPHDFAAVLELDRLADATSDDVSGHPGFFRGFPTRSLLWRFTGFDVPFREDPHTRVFHGANQQDPNLVPVKAKDDGASFRDRWRGHGHLLRPSNVIISANGTG